MKSKNRSAGMPSRPPGSGVNPAEFFVQWNKERDISVIAGNASW